MNDFSVQNLSIDWLINFFFFSKSAQSFDLLWSAINAHLDISTSDNKDDITVSDSWYGVFLNYTIQRCHQIY
jgi:hypothetical protein